jgi:hypothetical protein
MEQPTRPESEFVAPAELDFMVLLCTLEDAIRQAPEFPVGYKMVAVPLDAANLMIAQLRGLKALIERMG